MSASAEAIQKNNAGGKRQSPSNTDIKVPAIDGWYARYVLAVLFLVYVFNYVDRQILVVLAEEIKADLGISDAGIGFLYGTAFTVFYATFGIALGRLADEWDRRKLISIGLAFWSLMTALSGFARSFLPLASCRFGVGVGESSASPAAYSMLYDYFSPGVRTTVLAVFASGGVIGSPLGIFIGGTILSAWNTAWPDPGLAPLGLKGWQAAFMAVGLPGLILAVWVSTLREPLRGQGDGIYNKPNPYPFRESLAVLASMLPGFNLRALKKGGKSAVAINLIAGAAIIICIILLVRLTGDYAQWVAFGIAVYAGLSWAQALATRDPVVFGLIFHCRSLRYMILGLLIILIGKMGLGFWSIPLLQRYHGIDSAQIATVLGLGGVVVGFVGIILGGFIADRLSHHTAKGKLYVLICALTISFSANFVFLTVDDRFVIFASVLIATAAFSMAVAPILSTVNDLVLPRGRATTSAFYIMASSLAGFGLGPYFFGYISDLISTMGVDSGEALRQSLLWAMLTPVIGMPFLVLSLRYISADQQSLNDRARSFGECI